MERKSVAVTARRSFLRSAAALVAAALPIGEGFSQTKIRADAKGVLIVVDVQNCFMPGGTLAVPRGDEIVPVINRLARSFQNVVLTQDWHHPNHVSFASQHPGKKPFDSIVLPYGSQALWPDHCVQGTEDAALHKHLQVPNAQLVIRKGFRQDVDSYSAFVEADRKTSTGLAAYLRARGIRKCYVAGLATDFCVALTAIDARKSGFSAAVIEDASRAIDLNDSLAKAWRDMKAVGVERLQSTDFDS